MTWHSILGIVSSMAILCPILAILVLRLPAYKTFPALLIYYVSVLIYNLMTEGYLQADPEFVQYWGMVNNLLDAPLMMTFLLYFSTSPVFAKRMQWLIAAFVVFEVIVVATMGLIPAAITVILGPGLVVVLGLCLYFFVRETKLSIQRRKLPGKALINAGFVFAYGSFAIIYLMYYLLQMSLMEEAMLVYFVMATLSSLLVCAGIFIENKRIKKINELKIARRELYDIYAHEEKTVLRKGTVMLDFDREQWS